MALVPNRDLYNGLFAIFSDNLNCIKGWGFYMFSPEFDNEQELRTRVGVIWLCSLLDSVEGERRSLASYRKKATERGLNSLLPFCDQAERFVKTVEEILSRYSRDEQLFISDFRDQVVHSWLGRRHMDRFRVRHFDGKTIVREELELMAHADIVRPFYEKGIYDLDLPGLLSRFRDLNLRYWHVVIQMNAPGVLQQLQDALMNGKEFRIKALYDHIDGPAKFTFSPPRQKASR